MKTGAILGAGLTVMLLALAGPARAADTYAIDTTHSSVTFRVKHFGISWVHGRFLGMEGELKVDKKAPGKSSVKVTVDAASVYTNNKKRDGHLRSPDFFNVKQYPRITFESTRVRKVGRDYEVQGKLTLHGTTRPVKVRFELVGEGKGPRGKHRIGFEGKLSIKRSAYGMKKMIGPAGDLVEITVSIEGIKQ